MERAFEDVIEHWKESSEGQIDGEKRERYQNRIELLQGTLDLLILQTLQWGPQHGYGISVAIRNRSGELLQVDTGSLYPALHRLEKQKWIKAEWRISETNSGQSSTN